MQNHVLYLFIFLALGCNLPFNCPVKNTLLDKPCTGCYPYKDDGLCCRCKQQEHHYGYHGYH